jgi:hypothetical protein
MKAKRERGEEGQPASLDRMYPLIARWISQEEGWIEFGADHHSRALVTALYGGGMVWEGTDEYGSLDDALRAMEAGLIRGEVQPAPVGAGLGENQYLAHLVQVRRGRNEPGRPEVSMRRQCELLRLNRSGLEGRTGRGMTQNPVRVD